MTLNKRYNLFNSNAYYNSSKPKHNLDEISLFEFKQLAKILYDNFGLFLPENKKSLIVSRLYSLLSDYKISSYDDYIDRLQKDSTGKMISELIDKITTNHSGFFREPEHFDIIVKDILPEISQKKKKTNDNDIRIWSAGCATGEEPYSLQIHLFEYFKQEYSFWKLGVLATDISSSALSIAKKGEYNKQKVSSIPENILIKYFYQITPDLYKVNDKLKQEITFRRFNLKKDSFNFTKPFDLILCRNVMIYFDKINRDYLIKNFYNCLRPGGYLILGLSESLDSESLVYYNYHSPSIYRKNY